MKKNIILIGMMLLVLGIWYGCGEQQPQSQSSQPAQDHSYSTPEPEEKPDYIIPLEERRTSYDTTVYVVLDGSGSMGHDVCSGSGSKIDAAKQAAIEYINMLSPTTYCGLYIFDAGGDRQLVPRPYKPEGSREWVFPPLETVQYCKAELTSALSAADDGGGTDLCRAMRSGLLALRTQRERQNNHGLQILVVLADGASDDGNPANVIDECTKYGIEVHSIGFCINDKNNPLRAKSYAYTGATKIEDLRDAFTGTLKAEASTFEEVFH